MEMVVDARAGKLTDNIWTIGDEAMNILFSSL